MNPIYPTSIGAANQYYFNGTMNDARVYTRTMTATEVQLLYQSTTQPPVPTITSGQLTGPDFLITFTTVQNAVYEVDYRNDLVSGSWSILTNGVAGTGGIVTIVDHQAAAMGQRFYRVGTHF
jgi:hypothetical protein